MLRFVVPALAGVFAVFAVASCSDQSNGTFAGGTPEAGPEDAGVDSGDLTKGLLLKGIIITEGDPIDGELLIVPGGIIGCLQPGDTCAQDPRAAGVPTIEADVISPGIIDTHNHILFDIFDNSDWLPLQLYTNHEDWTKEVHYTEMVDVKQCLEDASQGKPTWCPAKYDGAGSLKCEMEKWGELKGLVAGTTSIVGLAGASFPCFGSLSRSIDTEYNGLDSDLVQTSALFPPSKTSADGVCANFTSGNTTSYIIHCGEGTDAKALAEFGKLGTASTTPECLYAEPTAITHGTAFTAAEFATMKTKGMKLVWSPASNNALYGATTNVPAALDAGVLVALAPDWSMGGSQNMLDEMRFAKKWSDDHWSKRLSAKDIHTMSTKNAATVLGLETKLGTLKEGYVADVFAVSGDKSKPYDAILAATPKEVRFSIVGGSVLYGDADLRKLGAGGSTCEDFDACGAAKFICVSEPVNQHDKLDQTFAQIQTALEAAMTDIDTSKPATAYKFAPVAPVVACK